MVITQDNSNNICKETIIQQRDNQTKTICYSAIKYCMKVKKRQITKFFTCFLWHLKALNKNSIMAEYKNRLWNCKLFMNWGMATFFNF